MAYSRTCRLVSAAGNAAAIPSFGRGPFASAPAAHGLAADRSHGAKRIPKTHHLVKIRHLCKHQFAQKIAQEKCPSRIINYKQIDNA